MLNKGSKDMNICILFGIIDLKLSKLPSELMLIKVVRSLLPTISDIQEEFWFLFFVGLL